MRHAKETLIRWKKSPVCESHIFEKERGKYSEIIFLRCQDCGAIQTLSDES